MTYIPGPVEVANTVKAKNGLDFPVVEDTDIWGGFQVVATIAERNAIPSVKLKVGMRVVVQADDLTYKLTVLSPATWVVDTGAGGVADGDKGDITVSASGATWTIDNAVVTNAKLANVATATFKGRTTAGTGSPEDLTATQATALLDTFTSALKGLAPASGGGTANYLRADGTWIIPPALKTPISTKTANYPITIADGTIIVDAASGPVTITLPAAAAAAEYHFTIKKIDTSSNTVTIAGTIDGTTNYVLYSQYEAVRVQSDGSVYWII